MDQFMDQFFDGLSVRLGQGVSEEEKAWFRKEIGEKSDWGRIAGETVRVYEVQRSTFKVDSSWFGGGTELEHMQVYARLKLVRG